MSVNWDVSLVSLPVQGILVTTLSFVLQGEVEAEMCELHHRLRGAAHELQLAREREEQLKQDLHTERTAIDRLGLSAFSRITVSLLLNLVVFKCASPSPCFVINIICRN